MSTQPVENARDMAPPMHVLHEDTWTALGCRPNTTCKASAKHMPAAKTSAFASLRIHCQIGQITSGSPLWRDLTKVISILNQRSWPPPPWEASTLEKSHSNSFLKGQCHEIFCFWFFSWISFPPAPEYPIRTVSNFFENSQRYLQVKVHHRYQRHRRQICHRYQQHRWQFASGINDTGGKFATDVNDTGGK